MYVRHHGGGTRYTYAHHPFDVVGWDGYLYPYAFNIDDFEPIIGRIHQPPPTFQTFEGPNFVICSFVPHKIEYHPDAIPVPYNHANVDSDELMLYTRDGRRGGQSTPATSPGTPPGSSTDRTPASSNSPSNYSTAANGTSRTCARS